MSQPETREERAESEERLLERLANRTSMPQEAAALARMVDFRIPLWSVLTALAVGMGVLISMYFQLQQVREGMTELQATVKAGNVQAISIAGELALMKYRIDNIENARARENGEPQIRR